MFTPKDMCLLQFSAPLLSVVWKKFIVATHLISLFKYISIQSNDYTYHKGTLKCETLKMQKVKQKVSYHSDSTKLLSDINRYLSIKLIP